MNKKHEMPAQMFFLMSYLTKEQIPTLEEFLFAGYSESTYYRTKRNFNAENFYLLKNFKERDAE